MLAILLGCTLFTFAADKLALGKPLKVAIEFDTPPYVENHAKEGFEVEVIKRSLPMYSVTFVQLPWKKISEAIKDGVANVEANATEGVTHKNPDDYYYSKNYIGFVNSVISHKRKAYEIESVENLAEHKIIIWRGAHLSLGPEFNRITEALRANEKKSNNVKQTDAKKMYIEADDSPTQVKLFWGDPASVTIMDEAIFRELSVKLSDKQERSMEEVKFHKLHLPVTKFKMAFKDCKTRDDFNKGLKKICSSGEYAKLMEKYGIPPKANICE